MVSPGESGTQLESELSLIDLFAGFRRHVKALVVCALAGVFLSGLISLSLAPVYVAAARILIEQPTGASGLMAAITQLPGGLSSLVGGAPQIAAEIEMLRSRPVATSVVLPLGADPLVPDVGQNLLVQVDDLALDSLWRTAWRRVTGEPDPEGGLAVEVLRWEFPEDFQDDLHLRFHAGSEVEIAIERWFDRRTTRMPWRPGQPLEFEQATLVLRPVEEALAGGHPGDPGALGSADELDGRRFLVRVGTLQRTVENFLEEIEIKETQRGSNVLRIAYPDSNAGRSARVVNALVSSYITHNRLRISNRAGRPVRFLEAELLRIRQELSVAEEELSAFGQNAGAIVLPESAGRLVERLAEIDLERARLELSATATDELVKSYDAGELSQRELAALEEVLLAESPPVEPLSSLLAQKRGLEAVYNEDWPELLEASMVVEERVSGLRAMLGARVQGEQRLSEDLDRIQARYMEELEGMPEAQVELLRYQRKVEAFSQIYLFLLGQLQEAKINEATATPNVDVIEAAVAPRKRSRPKLVTNLLLGLVLGLVGGIFWAFSRELARPLSSAEQLAQASQAAACGSVPHTRSLRARPLLGAAHGAGDPAARAARSVQELRASVTHAAAPLQARRLAVVSAGAQEGRSLVAANLALSLARTGLRVVLVDGDDVHSVLSDWFGVTPGPGLVAALEGEHRAALVQTEEGPLFLPAGTLGPDLADRMAGEAGARAIEALGEGSDWVVFDSAPLRESALATTLAARADAVLFVGRAGRTTEAAVQHACERLRRAGARILGSVLTDA